MIKFPIVNLESEDKSSSNRAGIVLPFNIVQVFYYVSYFQLNESKLIAYIMFDQVTVVIILSNLSRMKFQVVIQMTKSMNRV